MVFQYHSKPLALRLTSNPKYSYYSKILNTLHGIHQRRTKCQYIIAPQTKCLFRIQDWLLAHEKAQLTKRNDHLSDRSHSSTCENIPDLYFQCLLSFYDGMFTNLKVMIQEDETSRTRIRHVFFFLETQSFLLLIRWIIKQKWQD